MKSRSAKNKGARLQNWVKRKLVEILELKEEDIKTAVMGENGVDVKMYGENRTAFPYDIECKNVEKLNVWAAYDQASANAENEPLLIMKKNRREPLVVMDAVKFFELVSEITASRSDEVIESSVDEKVNANG